MQQLFIYINTMVTRDQFYKHICLPRQFCFRGVVSHVLYPRQARRSLLGNTTWVIILHKHSLSRQGRCPYIKHVTFLYKKMKCLSNLPDSPCKVVNKEIRTMWNKFHRNSGRCPHSLWLVRKRMDKEIGNKHHKRHPM